MKRIYTQILIALSLATPAVISAQCTGGTLEGNLVTTAAWQTQNNADGGKYFTFNTTAGWTYEFSYCAASGGGASAFDTQLTMLDNTGVYAGAYSDDYCGVQSYVSWVAPTTGTYRILSSLYFCGNQNNMGTLAYRHTAPTPPNCAAPSSPANGATNVCNSGTSLTWTTPVGGGAPTGYRMYFGTNNLPTNIVNGTNIGNVLTYNTGALLPSTTYYWYVVPTNGAGDAVGCSGQVRSFTTGVGCYVQPPTGTTNYSACGGSYYDSGNSGGNYGNGENGVITFCPTVAGQFVQVAFTSFQTEAGLDILT
ncbi:MAG TPA: fibronectin type III domain-containing protein, partial [Bacteroidia bacterium]|nr:fibronectin type III domain-containing protein [Bacteroidia bacterium]